MSLPRLLLAALCGGPLLLAQHPQQSVAPAKPMYVAPRSDEAQQQIAAFQLAPGLACSLVAAEPDLCNVVAFAIDDHGRFFVAETFRINDGVFDTRDHMTWKDDDLACLTVADRLAKYQKHIAQDIPKYSAFTERVRLLTDTNGDGVVDQSGVFAEGFAELECGIASGVLPVGNDLFFTNIPKLWRLRDTNGDGIADERSVLSDGYGVHTSLIGHDLHGLILGPDRRLYFSIGDRGFALTTQEGVRLAYPHEGAVLRCELSGSGLEVVHHGLRNPQELAFDDYGRLFTGDNNSDGGDRARFVHIVEGGDSGWRIGYQWLDDRGAWNREQLWWPQHPGQPGAYIPPIINVSDGPSGLAFDPGTGSPERYRGCFFLCDFRGGAGYSGVHALQFVAKGAGFELLRREKPIWGVLATDVDFGPDGAMYVLDWVTGWNKSGKGRIYRVEREGLRNDFLARANAQLIHADFASKNDAQLLVLLAHPDRRIRQKAQFALCDRNAASVLLAATKNLDQRLARLHGIWGLGILGRKDSKATDELIALLGDDDAEVRGNAAKVLGDCRRSTARPALLPLLSDPNSRVRFEAAIALGRLGANDSEGTVQALLAMLRDNDDRDPYLRHAAVTGLALIGDRARVINAVNDESVAVRHGALLTLRRLGAVECALLLNDASPALRAEAARAIYDGPVEAALPALAALTNHSTASDPAFGWRALNAARLLGTQEHAAQIAAYAAEQNNPLSMRNEAVRILAEWQAPHGQDRVLGNWRPCKHDDAAKTIAMLQQPLIALLADDATAASAAEACGRLRCQSASGALSQLVTARNRTTEARVAALQALDTLDSAELDRVVASIGAEDPVALRKTAVSIFSRRDPRQAVPVLASLCEQAELGERQAAFQALGNLKNAAADGVLALWLTRFSAGKVDPSVQLDVLEAAQHRTTKSLLLQLDAITIPAKAAGLIAEHAVCLEGGDAEAGRRIFFDNEATRCTRCHTANGSGGNAGPVLDGIGTRQTRGYLLESLINPSAKIAQGFATTVLRLHNGDTMVGVLTKDQDGGVLLVDMQGNLQTIGNDRIRERSASAASAMPSMTGSLTKLQIRDVIAYLASLQQPAK
ncbi:MAG: HEAT repeat domain-containing protein [Planctomycetota bacterium]|nr:HEAT repeat domain-containing protein [Planctomycetota bacterium]